MGDGRLAVNEFGAAFRGIAELRSRQRADAAAAPVARLQDGDLLSRGCKLARGHQAGGACPDDDDISSAMRHTDCLSALAVFDPVAQKHRAAISARLPSSVIAVTGAR